MGFVRAEEAFLNNGEKGEKTYIENRISATAERMLNCEVLYMRSKTNTDCALIISRKQKCGQRLRFGASLLGSTRVCALATRYIKYATSKYIWN